MFQFPDDQGNQTLRSESKIRINALNEQLKRMDLIFDVEFFASLTPTVRKIETRTQKLMAELEL
jgi:hypothetical protein